MNSAGGQIKTDRASDHGRGLILDALLLSILIAAALLTQSAAILATMIFSAFLLWHQAAGYVVQRQWRKGRLSHLEFGAGKLEQAWSLFIGNAMIVGGIWMVARTLELIEAGESQVSPRNFAIAATATAFVTLRAGISLIAALRTPEGGSRPFSRTRVQSRLRLFAILLAVQIALTVAALTDDPIIALLADGFGTIFMAVLLAAGGARLFALSVADLIDYPLNRKDHAILTNLIRAAGIHDHNVLDLRTRRSGGHIFAELTIDPGDTVTFEEARRHMIRLRQSLADEFDNLDAVIKLRTSEG